MNYTHTNNHVQPFYLAKVGAIFDDILVRCQEDLECTNTQVTLKGATLCRIALVRDNLDTGCPLGKFTRPICHSRKRDNDKIGAALPLIF